VNIEDFFITEELIFKQLEERFGVLKDIFTEKKPAPVTSIQDYCGLHGLNIERLKFMAYDVDYAVDYLSKHTDIKIELYGKSQKYRDVFKQDNITIHPTNSYLTEHINLIYTSKGELPYVWFEPYHVRQDDTDIFGFENETDWKLQKRLRPKLFKIQTKEQEENILHTFEYLKENDGV
jgi:hypothetical protein